METELEIRRFRGFTVRELTKQSGLVTTELIIQQGVTIPKHYHANRQKAYFVINGSCEVFAGGHLMPLDDGDALEIPAGMLHAITAGELGVCLLVSFTEPADDTIWENEKPERIS